MTPLGAPLKLMWMAVALGALTAVFISFAVRHGNALNAAIAGALVVLTIQTTCLALLTQSRE